MNTTIARLLRPSILMMALIILAMGATQVNAEEGPNRAALVIRFEDGSVRSSCVAFAEQSISGEELLKRAGVSLILDYGSGNGGAVCSINNNGCAYPIDDCFCRCMGVQCEYWAYYHWNGDWQYSQVGATAFQVSDGALEGWSWGPGNFSTATEPPPASFQQICSPSTATATATATASATAAPTATSAPVPAAVAVPQINASITSTMLQRGECALLDWVTWDANEVTLNGAVVLAQDRREVCPLESARFTLVASNSGGQTVREIVVGVLPETPMPPAIEAAPVGQAPPVPQLQPPPSAQTPPETIEPSSSRGDEALPPATVASVDVPTKDRGLSILPVADAAFAPRATQSPPLAEAKPASVFEQSSLAALRRYATATPWPRVPLGIDGRPTPTPMLVAKAPSGPDTFEMNSALTTASAPNAALFADQDAAPRGFSLDLLPGYGSFFFATALLVGAGVLVTRRRQGGGLGD